jgi:pyruvate dehydrogenase E1 component beta subunit
VKVHSLIATLLSEGETLGDSLAKKVAEAEPPARTQASEVRSVRGQGTPTPDAEAAADPEVPEDTEFVQQTVREALRDAMAEEMRRDDLVFLMGEEVAQYQGAYKVSQDLLEEFGERRVIDTPISEHGFAGLGIGTAFGGLKPIVEFMTWNFAMQAMDQLINSAAKTRYMSGGQMSCSIVFRGPNGAAARVAAQHSQDYSAWYASVPGVKVIAPYFAADAKGLLKAAIRDPNPVIFLENEIVYGRTFPVPKLDDFVLPIGKARIVRPGKDVTLVSYSIAVGLCLEAAEKLAEEGVSAEVIDLRTLRPLDIATALSSVKKTHRIVTVEQGWPICSIGSEVCARVALEAFDWLDAPPGKVSGKDVPMPYAANLEKLALPSVEEVIEAVKAMDYSALKAAAGDGARVFASPLARRLAAQKGIELARLVGTGPRGRVVKSDVENARSVVKAVAGQDEAAAGGMPSVATLPDARLFYPEGSYDETPHDSIRKAIAKRLTSAKTLIPHYDLTIDCNLNALLAVREKMNAAAPLVQDGERDKGKGPAYKLSLNDFVVKAAAMALMRHREVNASWTDTAVLHHKDADVGVAVALDFGLITPIVFKAQVKSLVEISAEIKALAVRARGKKLKPSEYEGGSFSVSNLGMFGIKNFTAIINPPQSCIIAVGAAEARAIVVNGKTEVASMITVTKSADHRVVDGSTGAKFLVTLKQFIEEPASMLL